MVHIIWGVLQITVGVYSPMRPPLTYTVLYICYRKYFIVVCSFFVVFLDPNFVENFFRTSTFVRSVEQVSPSKMGHTLKWRWEPQIFDTKVGNSLAHDSFIRASWAWTTTCRTIFGCPELFVSNKCSVNCNFLQPSAYTLSAEQAIRAVKHDYSFRFIINTFRPAGIHASHRLRGAL